MNNYFDAKIETMSADQLRELQLKLLNTQLKQAGKAPAYRGLLPDSIPHIEDIQDIPFTTKEDLKNHFPYGFLAVPRTTIARFNASSGTTGIPTLAYFSEKDLDAMSQRAMMHLTMAGLKRGDIVQSMLGTGLFVGGWYHNNAAFHMGATVLPTGTGNTLRQIELLKQLKATFCFTTSGYAQYLLSRLTEADIEHIQLHTILIGAEPLPTTFYAFAKKHYHVELYGSYGMTECGGPVAHECCCHTGLHLAEHQFYVEIVDLKTGKPVKDGTFGELIITPLCQEAFPLIRYRTRDITRILPGTCPCGRTHRRIDTNIYRQDDMMIINGVNIFPSQIEACIYKSLPVATNYLIRVQETNGLKRLHIDIELPADMMANQPLQAQLEQDITLYLKAYITVTPTLHFVPIGTLPAVSGKALRLQKES